MPDVAIESRQVDATPGVDPLKPRAPLTPAPVTRKTGPRSTSIAALVAADAAAWLLCTAVIFLIRTVIWGAIPMFWALWATGVAWILFRFASGLYPPVGISQPDELRRSVRTTMAAAAIHGAMILALDEYEVWRLMGLLVWPLVIPTVYFARAFAKAKLIQRQLWGDPYVIIGTGERGKRVIREMQAYPELGLMPVAAFGDQPELWGGELEGVPVLGPIDSAHRYEFPFPIRHAMIALGRKEATNARVREITTRLTPRHPTIQIFHDLTGIANLWVQPRPVGAYLALELRNARFSKRQQLIKRIFDVLMSLPVFLVALPIIGVAALLVKIISPGPAFFSQAREGQKGQPIRIWKIRTMVTDAEKRLSEYLAQNEAARFEYERTLKLRHDPRVIPGVGAFLRRASIDELPQLWNIIKGDMSLVGPRIMPAKEVELYSVGGRELRRDVPPGLTGLWQVMFRNNSDLHVREIADAYYVNNWSVWLDSWIVLRTVRVVFAGAGAY